MTMNLRLLFVIKMYHNKMKLSAPIQVADSFVICQTFADAVPMELAVTTRDKVNRIHFNHFIHENVRFVARGSTTVTAT